MNSDYDETAKINLIDNLENSKDCLSRTLIDLFEKINPKNNYKLCVSGEVFRILVNKFKSISKEFQKDKIDIHKFNIIQGKIL